MQLPKCIILPDSDLSLYTCLGVLLLCILPALLLSLVTAITEGSLNRT